jgi:transcription initiation factor TFIID subunit 1, fungi type
MSKEDFGEPDLEFDEILSGQIATFDNLFDGKTQHAETAIDFSDEEELAEEEESSGQKDNTHRNGGSDDDDDDDDDDEDGDEEDDFMKELEQEALEGVEKDEQPEDTEMNAVFGIGVPKNAGLQDLDFASNSLLDSTKQIGDSDIELSDLEEEDNKLEEALGLNVNAPTSEPKDANSNTASSTAQNAKLKQELRAQEAKKRKEEEQRKKEERMKERNEIILRTYYPDFEKGKPMRLQELFPIVPLDYSYQQPPPVVGPLLPKMTHFEVDVDQRSEFQMSTKKLKELQKQNKKSNFYMPGARIVQVEIDEIQKTQTTEEPAKRPISKINYDTELIISTADWNDDEIFNASKSLSTLPSAKRLKVEDNNLDAWADDDDDMIFEGNLDMDSINLKLDMNDPNMIFFNVDHIYPPKDKVINSNADIPTTQRLLEQKFSVSNDQEYESLKSSHQTKVRATVGALHIDHAPIALRLQSPYYKVRPSEKENRIYHRLKFSVKTNVQIFFSKPKTRKKKKDKGKDVSELFAKSTDLSLGDTAPFFLAEFCEEYPAVFNKLGMGSKVINYYRKITEDDNTRPKLSIGETHILGVHDKSPFWNFGFVEKGSIVPTLYNKLFRAPLFHHEAYSTDFLFIKSSGGGNGQRFFLRPMNYLFTVGQTLPAVEVPGPHSRRTAQLMKHRLRMIAYRALNASEHTRITVKDISEHFPKQSDMQIRQRLKEFMEYQRGGPDQGYWRLKNIDKLPSYEQIRRMMSAEDVAILDVMMWGHQKFEDMDIFRRERLQIVDENAKKERSEANPEDTLSQQLAPWNTTRNFVLATQGKSMLQINNDVDHTRPGQAISFLKQSMKYGPNKLNDSLSKPGTPAPGGTPAPAPAPQTYNVAAQQKMYNEQIRKAWHTQASALSTYRNTDKPRIIELDELSDAHLMNRANRIVDEEVDEKPRYIKITRMVKNAYGIKERRVQIIKDPKVVELYVKKKQEQLLQSAGTENDNAVLITNDEEENMKVKKLLEEELAKLEKQAEKKKKKQVGITAANIDSEGRISGKGIGKGKSTSRRCATCGSLGHIRTNKTCPLYYTVHNKSNPNYIPGSEKVNEASTAPSENAIPENTQTTT